MDKAKQVTNETASGRTGSSKSKYRAQKARDPSQSHGKSKNQQVLQMSASGIHNGDVGVFVTCSKGDEKKCLQELANLLDEHIADEQSEEQQIENKQSNEANRDNDIEADILAELDELRPKPANGSPSKKLTLITLDIPCVTFVRFPTRTGTDSTLDPVDIVHKLCVRASQKEDTGPRSRYIQRLTPVSLIRKTLNNGLESLCEEVLPPHFLIKPDSTEEQSNPVPAVDNQTQPVKFAIRPTIRNNNKMDRDQVIRTVADKITALGQGKHTVDLKGYEKLVLVDVYRNVVGMSVVGSEYESLKRFNLAELHASHFDDDKQEQQDGKATTAD